MEGKGPCSPPPLCRSRDCAAAGWHQFLSRLGLGHRSILRNLLLLPLHTDTHIHTHTHPYLRTFPQRRFAAKNKPSCGEKADILISGLVQVKALRVPHLAPVPLSDQRVLF